LAPGNPISTDSTPTPNDSTGPAPTDSTLTPAPTDSTLLPPTDSVGIDEAITSNHTGIAFGNFNMSTSLLTTTYSGTTIAVASTSGVLAVLTEAQAKRGRIVLKLSGGSQSHVKNADGTFSLTKWKAVVDRFRTFGLGQFIADGTIIGHYLIDEPNMAHRWGGKIIPQATVEAMAKYSKSIWPTMPTLVRVVPTWLASAPVTYTNLDAGWAQYTAVKGDVTRFAANEVAAAKSKGLGLIMSMNVLDGGNGSSGIRGTVSGKYSMSASELRTYGTALLNQTYTCAFYNWMYSSTYYGRSDIKSAMGDLSAKARAHVKTSCRQ
jgi:hypothetical protein